MEGFNVERAQSLSHVFHFFVSAGKACLVPFLPLYLRYLGLSSLQTGVVVGLQCAVAMCIGPLWLYCANACRKRRLVLLFSLLVAIVAGVLLSLVPTAHVGGMAGFCNNTSTVLGDGSNAAALDFPVNNSTIAATSVATSAVKPVSMPVSEATNEQSEEEAVAKGTSVVTTTTTPEPTTTTTTTATTTATTTKLTTTSKTESAATSTSTTAHGRHSNSHRSNWDSLSPELQSLFKEAGYSKTAINKKDPLDFQIIFDQLQKLLNEDREQSGNSEDSREKRDILAGTLASINDKLASWQVNTAPWRTLIMVLVVVIVAELLSAPVETLADTLWFEFLDGLDFLERYGSQRVWSTLGLIIFPLIVTSVVDRTQCMLTETLHHFVLHFYFFAIVLAVAFMLAFCFPIFNEKKKVVRRTSIFKGCRVIFTDVHTFCYIFTVLLLGVATAAVDTFLFWRVQDLGGAELYMGGAVSLAAVSQFFLLAFSKLLIRKLSNPGCIVLALLVLCVRLVIYSFMHAPWVVLPTALLFGFSNTLIWGCVENYQDFKANPLIMDRSTKALIDSLYKGVAYGGGSIAAGYLYGAVGWDGMLQGGSLVALSWAMLFAVLQRCVPHKHKVRYAKLLQAEEDQESDDEEESVYDGDWLEIALKHDK